MPGRRLLVLTFILIPFHAWSAATETQATMQRIFNEVRYLLPLSFDVRHFQDPNERLRIENSLSSLAEATGQLKMHGSQGGPAFAYLGESLANQVNQVRRQFSRGHLSESQFLLQQLTETCVACHSRMKVTKQSNLAARFIEGIDQDTLGGHGIARLSIATRQFDQALDSFERRFEDQSIPAVTVDLEGSMIDYLTVAIRVKKNYARPVVALQKFLKRKDLPVYLRSNVEGWIDALETLRHRTPKKDPIAEALWLVTDSQEPSIYASERDSLVYDIAAAGVLHRYIESDVEEAEKRGQTFYLLGLTELRSQRNYWLSDAGFYLKTSIRTAPKTEHARDAFAVLEEYTILGFSGSRGVEIPEEVESELNELRRLLDGD